MTTQLCDVEAWAQWRNGRRGRQRWGRWSLHHPALIGWDTANLASPTTSPRTDAMQAALVALAQDGEGDAAITLLVQLRPGLNRLARALADGRRTARPDSNDEVRSAFFETLYRHPLHRRPTGIAANLVLDTRQRLARATVRATRASAAASIRRSEAVDIGSEAGVVASLDRAVERLPGTATSRRLTAELAYRAWVLEEPQVAIAADLGLGHRGVAMRLHRLRAALRGEGLEC